MSEADLPAHQPLSQSTDSEMCPPPMPVEPSAAIFHKAPPSNSWSTSEDDHWQTINFPHALDIDSLPVAPARHPSLTQESGGETASKSIDSKTSTHSTPAGDNREESPQLIQGRSFVIQRDAAAAKNFPDLETGSAATAPNTLIQALHECNRDLAVRVMELETALEQYQKTLQEQETAMGQRTQDLTSAQEQVTHLFCKLELTNQVVRQQEVLAETLKAQWERSQLRQAELERECAFTQQRYNEQSHQLVQAETMCRELRTRLQRQQRHTLQFKVALERCLEMPSREDLRTNLFEPLESSDFIPTGHPVLLSDVEEILPLNCSLQATPVRPWSTHGGGSSGENSISAEMRSRLSKDIVEKTQDLLNATDSEVNIQMADIAPTLSVSETPQNLPIPEASPHAFALEESPQPPEPTVFQELEAYWHLEKKPVSAATTDPDTTQQLEAIVSPSESATITTPQGPKIDFSPWESLLSFGNSPEMPQVVALDQRDQANVNQPQGSQNVSQHLPRMDSPAPLLHPQRQAKKRSSLAAIELPTFAN